MNRQEAQNLTDAAEITRAAFEQYRNELHRYLTRRLNGAQDAQDLAQDVYLRFMQVSQHETVREPQAFLYRLASNLVYEFRLRERRSLVTFDSDAADERCNRAAGTGEENDGLGERLCSAQELAQVLQRLPKTYQVVLLLRKRDGLSPDDIAQRLGLSKSTVYTYLIRAVAQFKFHFKAMQKAG